MWLAYKAPATGTTITANRKGKCSCRFCCWLLVENQPMKILARNLAVIGENLCYLSFLASIFSPFFLSSPSLTLQNHISLSKRIKNNFRLGYNGDINTLRLGFRLIIPHVSCVFREGLLFLPFPSPFILFAHFITTRFLSTLPNLLFLPPWQPCFFLYSLVLHPFVHTTCTCTFATNDVPQVGV